MGSTPTAPTKILKNNNTLSNGTWADRAALFFWGAIWGARDSVRLGCAISGKNNVEAQLLGPGTEGVEARMGLSTLPSSERGHTHADAGSEVGLAQT